MSGMDEVFLLLILVGGFWEAEAISVTGEQGGDVTIHCSHIHACSNIKYFCTDPCRHEEDVLIRSTEEIKGRYRIREEGNTFHVTISHLTADDAGTYYCGIDRFAFDTYNKVVLTVKEGNTQDHTGAFTTNAGHRTFTTKAGHLTLTTNAPHFASSTTAPSSSLTSDSMSGEKLLYIGASLGVVLLALAAVLLIFFKHRNRAVSEMYQNTEYAVPWSPSRNNHDIIASPSSARDDEATEGTKTSRDQSGNVHYSSVNFDTVAGRRDATHPSATVTYSVITHIAADECALYCNV